MKTQITGPGIFSPVRLLYFEPWDSWKLFDIHCSSFRRINIIKKSLPQNIFAASTRIFAPKNVSRVTVETLCNILKGNVQIAFCDFWWVLIISQPHSRLESGACDTKTMQPLVSILGRDFMKISLKKGINWVVMSIIMVKSSGFLCETFHDPTHDKTVCRPRTLTSAD